MSGGAFFGVSLVVAAILMALSVVASNYDHKLDDRRAAKACGARGVEKVLYDEILALCGDGKLVPYG